MRAGAASESRLGLGDPGLRAVLLLAVALLLLAWSRVDGYQLADSVEYLDRARSFVRGEGLGAERSVRSFAFSALFVPLFGAFELLGLEDQRLVVPLGRVVQMLLTLGLVVATARVGERVAGPRAGRAAALVAAANPVVAVFGVSPVSGVAAGLGVALGLDALLARQARGLAAGAWLGAAVLMAYQSLLVALPLLALLALRERLRRPVWAALAAFGAALGAQVALDRLAYGVWGLSLARYLSDNGLGALGRIAYELGLNDLAKAIYGMMRFEYSVEGAPPAVRQMQPPDYYLTHLPEMVAVPLVALLALGLARAAARPRWSSSILALALAANVAIMSTKGSKSFRLWLPLVPLYAPLIGLGWETLRGAAGARFSGVRRLLAHGLLLAGAALGAAALLQQDTRTHAPYWRAAEHVEALAAPDGAPLRVASAYHWACFLRFPPRVEHVKLPRELDSWERLDDAGRAEVLATLEGLDALLVHLPALSEHPELFREVAARFAVDAAWYDQTAHGELGPVFVLRRRAGDPAERLFFERLSAADPLALRRARHLPPSTRFGGGPGEDELVLLGFEVEPLRNAQGTGHAWITYTWLAPRAPQRDWTVWDRATAPDERHSWHNNHRPGYGVLPTPTWEAGDVVREGYLLVASSDALYADRPYRPMGGSYRRGDWIPTSLWVGLVALDEAGEVVDRLPARPPLPSSGLGPEALAGDALRDLGDQALWRRTPPGYAVGPDGRAEVGRFLCRVHPRARVPDDGRPIPD